MKALKINLLFFALGFLALNFSCKKADPGNNDAMSEGIITGPDLRYCMNCGGYFITIDGSKYRFYELPKGSDIDLNNAKYPINVDLRWTKNSGYESSGLITIQNIRKD
jgi:hypothetical protein